MHPGQPHSSCSTQKSSEAEAFRCNAHYGVSLLSVIRSFHFRRCLPISHGFDMREKGQKPALICYLTVYSVTHFMKKVNILLKKSSQTAPETYFASDTWSSCHVIICLMQHRISLILYSKKELATAFWVSARLFSCWGVQQPKERSKGLYCFHLQPLWFPPIFSSLMLRYSVSDIHR